MYRSGTSVIRLDTVLPKEYPALVDLWEASVRATHHFVSEDEIQYYRPIILHEYLRQMALTCARTDQGQILGFAGAAAGKLEMLFLHPSARGKGVGTRLVQHVIRHQKVTKVDVNEENEQALGFYRHLGFQVEDRSPLDGMNRPHPILHMTLNLPRLGEE
ncbi:GNAT family N-acetyltransferase [Rufibacter latericius]|uniref:GNAT family N-acetyltransferase n=1 Tax=Rufibacter latericius TaxID=2487040 RepID=A0A3M9MKC1_9BACT|nr:GNAT family N-acetyltransferase [Rufibacter latericius]RNI25929.1 GNAT family N-acetyltransferase [Rufibacter latericius]